MFNSTAPTGLVWPMRKITSATRNPSADPASSARCGVSRFAVCYGKPRRKISSARERIDLPPVRKDDCVEARDQARARHEGEHARLQAGSEDRLKAEE